jgi:hypothetical protein
LTHHGYKRLWWIRGFKVGTCQKFAYLIGIQVFLIKLSRASLTEARPDFCTERKSSTVSLPFITRPMGRTNEGLSVTFLGDLIDKPALRGPKSFSAKYGSVPMVEQGPP